MAWAQTRPVPQSYLHTARHIQNITRLRGQPPLPDKATAIRTNSPVTTHPQPPKKSPLGACPTPLLLLRRCPQGRLSSHAASPHGAVGDQKLFQHSQIRCIPRRGPVQSALVIVSHRPLPVYSALRHTRISGVTIANQVDTFGTHIRAERLKSLEPPIFGYSSGPSYRRNPKSLSAEDHCPVQPCTVHPRQPVRKSNRSATQAAATGSS